MKTNKFYRNCLIFVCGIITSFSSACASPKSLTITGFQRNYNRNYIDIVLLPANGNSSPAVTANAQILDGKVTFLFKDPKNSDKDWTGSGNFNIQLKMDIVGRFTATYFYTDGKSYKELGIFITDQNLNKLPSYNISEASSTINLDEFKDIYEITVAPENYTIIPSQFVSAAGFGRSPTTDELFNAENFVNAKNNNEQTVIAELKSVRFNTNQIVGQLVLNLNGQPYIQMTLTVEYLGLVKESYLTSIEIYSFEHKQQIRHEVYDGFTAQSFGRVMGVFERYFPLFYDQDYVNETKRRGTQNTSSANTPGRTQEPPKPPPFPATHRLTADLNAFEEQDGGSKVVTSLKKDSEVQVLEYGEYADWNGITAKWVKIKTPSGATGWLFSGYLTEIRK